MTVPVEARIKKIKDWGYKFAYSYPDKPHANSNVHVEIKNSGRQIAGSRVTKIEKQTDGYKTSGIAG